MSTLVLLIEDEFLIRNSLQDFLEIEDYRVVTTGSGRAGIHLAGELVPDLVLCDIMMPEPDGFEVLTSLKQNPTTAQIPFVFISALVEPATRQRAEELGAAAFIAKPFSRQHLLEVITSFLALAQV